MQRRPRAPSGRQRGVQLGVATADVRIEPAAGRSDGIGGNGVGLLQSVFFAISFDPFLDCVVELLRSRSQVAAAGVGGVVTITSGRRTRMEILIAAEVLTEQLRAAHGSILVHTPAAIGSVAEGHLSDAE